MFYVQYAHARVVLDPAQRRATSGLAPESHPELLTHEKEGELLRALAEFPRVVAAAAELREPHRVARYLEEHAARLSPVLRQLPGAAAWATRSPTTSTGRGWCSSTRPASCWPTVSSLLGVSAPERM